jgi:hypothetical protein
MIRWCAVLLAATTPLSAQTPSAPAAAEQQANAWLVAFDSGDRATLLEYLKENHPSSVEEIDGEMGFRAQTRGGAN